MTVPAIPTSAEILRRLKLLPEAQRAQLDVFLREADPGIWVPQPGPQTMAYNCLADILFYGGAAGGGKTELLLGLALTAQEHAIIFRRQGVQLKGLVTRMAKILGTRDGYNSQDKLWRLPGDRLLELGSVNEPEDWEKYAGRPHDAKLYDEICHFTETQFRTLNAWMRTDNPKVRQRIVCAGNPPTGPEGEWVKRFWAPWLDPRHPNPAKPGELRWYISNEKGEDQEVPGPEPVMVSGELMQPKSRTFIPSRVDGAGPHPLDPPGPLPALRGHRLGDVRRTASAAERRQVQAHRGRLPGLDGLRGPAPRPDGALRCRWIPHDCAPRGLGD